jgi:DNA polymerase-3 subunit delta
MGTHSQKQEEHAFKKIEKDIRNDRLGNPLFFYGREQYLIRWAISALVEKYVNPSTKDMDFSKPDPKSMTLDTLIQQCETLPFLSTKRVVLIEDFLLFAGEKLKGFPEEGEEGLIEYLKNVPKDCVLIFTASSADKRRKLYKTIQSVGSCYEFDGLDETLLRGLIEKRLRQGGKWARPNIIGEMIQLSGYYDKETDYTLYHLENDISKVIALCDGDEIKREDIKGGITGNGETYVFDLIDAVSLGNKEEAFSLLNNLLTSGVSAHKLLALVCSQFETILMVKEMKEDGLQYDQIKDFLGIHEFRIKRAVSFANHYTLAQLRNALNRAFQVDDSIKSGLMDAKLALEMLIATI